MKNRLINDNIRITFLIGGMGAGGMERQLLYLIKTLVKTCSVQLIVFNDDIFYKQIFELPVNLVILKRKDKYTIKTFIRVFKELKYFRPSIIQVWSNILYLFVLPYRLFYKVKVVNSSIRYAGKITISTASKLIQKIAFTFSHLIISNSEAGLAVENLLSSGKATFIHNAFDLSAYQKKQVKIPEDISAVTSIFAYKVVMVGRFSKSKDYNAFVQVAKNVAKKRPEVGFFCIGEGPGRCKIENEAGSLLNKNIFFLGKRNDIQQIIHVFNIGVLLNNTIGHAEGISNALMEYMAAGMPVIATNAGGTPELVKDKQSGFLVPAFKPQAVAEKIIFLLENEEQMKKMGQKGLDIIKNDFSIEKMTSSYMCLYRRLLDEQ